uniref:G-protein coupled receptors family 1 profile domain-containing protein n=1 Tax=Leptobrachium leishanense TaxID=445787 RepID=A0A8C5W6B1_9ANUR
PVQHYCPERFLYSQNTNYCFDFNNSCPMTSISLLKFSSMCIIMSLVIITTVAGNLLVIISVTHFKQLHTPTNFLILSLAITDFLLGLMVMPYSMARSITSCWYFGDLFCTVHSCLDMTFCTSSIFHLFFISLDRYYAVCQPLHYYRKITIHVIEICLFISWFVPCAYSFGLMMSNQHMEGLSSFLESHACSGSCGLILNKLWGTITSLISFFVPGSLIIIIYIHIFSIARRQAKIIHSFPNYLCSNTCSKTSIKAENKAAKTLGLVMGTFLLCWLPFSIVAVIDPYLDFTTSHDLYDAALWLGYFNSALNPIIYALFYPWFQKTFKHIIKCNIFNSSSIVLCIP